jgi:hypothetical protein
LPCVYGLDRQGAIETQKAREAGVSEQQIAALKYRLRPTLVPESDAPDDFRCSSCDPGYGHVPSCDCPCTMSPVVHPDDVVVEDTGEGAYQVEVRADGLRFLADEPLPRGLASAATGAYQLLGAALGACTVITLKLYAERKQMRLDRVAGEGAPSARSGDARGIVPPRDPA